MQFKTRYTLDKEHYKECFEQSASLKPKTWHRFIKAGVMFLLGIFFYYTQIERISAHLGQFFFILAFVDVLSVIYARAWWVARQMISKASGGDIDVEIDAQGVAITSDYVKQQFLWQEIQSFVETEKGVIFVTHKAGQYYLSKQHFNDDGWAFLIGNLEKATR